MLLLVGVQLLLPWIVRILIEALTTTTFPPDTLRLITQLTAVALAIYLARAGLQFLRSYLAHIAGWGVVADVPKQVYEHIQRLSLHFYEDKQTGQLMSRMINDTGWAIPQAVYGPGAAGGSSNLRIGDWLAIAHFQLP